MSTRFRLYPTSEQEAALLRHCSDARFVWNLGQEQRAAYRPGRGPVPGYLEQSRQLTEARAAEPWLAEGSHIVQQQALRDLDQAWQRFFSGTLGRPGWRKAGKREGFRIVGKRGNRRGCMWNVRRLSRHVGEVRIPKVGRVRFRWSRPVSDDAKSYRVTRDRSGRWHIAFAGIPEPIAAPGVGKIIGIDRGIAVTLALSDGTTFQVPVPRPVVRLQRQLSRAKRGSNRRAKVKARLVRRYARNTDARKDWAEKASTEIARRYDLIRIEDLKVQNMTRRPKVRQAADGSYERNGAAAKAAVNGSVLAAGWGFFSRRLEGKARGRVEKVNPAYTSQRCSACGHVDKKSRKSQARFVCTACGFACNADVNAAINIAAGHAVTARGGVGAARPANREPLVA